MRNKAKTIWEPFPGAQKQFLSCPAWETLLHGPRAGGKSQPLHCKVLTPKGWKTIGDMKIGSRICNPDGTTSTVIGVFPQGEVQTYKVKVDGGGVTYCSADHLWYAKIANKSRHKQVVDTPLDFDDARIHTTQQLIDDRKRFSTHTPIIPVPKPIKFTHQGLYKYSFDPYLLGLLLGDGSVIGHASRIEFTTIDKELAEYVSKFEFQQFKCEIGTIEYHAKIGSSIYKNVKLAKLLGCKSNSKFIPKKYLYGKIEDRLAVLQGLMDTDGYAQKNGRKAIFTSVSKQLASDVRFLVHSLGGRTSFSKYRGKYKKDGVYVHCQIAYDIRITFSNNGDLFRLKRKKERCEGKTYQHNYIGRKIKAITPYKIESCQCIKVDNPNGLYITDDFIVTHNTDVLIMDFLQDVGVGYGQDHRGLLLRLATTELGDVIAKTKKWIPQIFPDAKFNASKKIWTFVDGETLWLNYARTEDDYLQYHGAEKNWIGFEELTNWPFADIYLKLMSINRSSNPKIKKKYRATCNPSGPGHCVPFGDVLTPSGWVDIKDIKISDPVFTVDENGIILESTVSQIHKSYYEGAMIHVDKRGLSITCTPNHKLPKLGGTVGSKNKKFTLLEYNDLPGDTAILRSCEHIGNIPKDVFTIPKYNLKRLRKSKIKQPNTCEYLDFMHLLGWFLSEGGTQKLQNSFSISKSEIVHPNQFKEISDLLTKIGLKFTSNKKGFIVYSRDWFQLFSKFGSYEDKYIPKYCKNLTKKYLRKMFNAMMDGDGTWYTREQSGEYYTTSKQLASDVCEVALKLGYVIGTRKNINEHKRDCYTVRIKRTSKKHSNISTGNHKYKVNTTTKNIDTVKKDFSGNIYCIGVEGTHTFIIRQKTSVWISGNSWVKQRFIDQSEPGKIIYDEFGQSRTHIFSPLSENKAMLAADPMYLAKLMAMTEDNKMLRDAWVHGSWNLITGGFFTDVIDWKKQILPDFSLPKSWRIFRSFDWGSSKPWAVTYFCETNGEQPDNADVLGLPYFPRDSVILINEIYGWNGEINTGDRAISSEIAERVLELDNFIQSKYKIKVVPGPADTSIWTVTDGVSIAGNMVKYGLFWTKAYKGAGSRISGWALLRQMLGASKRSSIEHPGLYMFEYAKHHKRTFPLLIRDKINPEDIDSSLEDHCADSCRYGLARKLSRMKQRVVRT